jgi:hypothetical protein
MKSVFFLLFLSTSIGVFGQKNPYNPRILFLTPYSFKYDSSFTKDIHEIETHIHEINYLGEDLSGHPPNIQTTIQSVQNYTKMTDIRGFLNLMIGEQFLFTMFRGDRNFIVLMDTLKVYGTADELKAIADRFDVQHIVTFPEVNLYYKDTVGFGSLTMNVYDRTTNSMTLEYHDTEDWIIEEYEYSEGSDEKTASALLYNLSIHAKYRIQETIGKTNPIYREQRKKYREEHAEEEMFPEFWELEGSEQGRKNCLNHLAKTTLKAPYSLEPFKTVMDSLGKPFSTTNVYQILYNEDSSKFVAFLVDPWHKNSGLKSMNPVEEHCIEAKLIRQKNESAAGLTDYFGSVIRGVNTPDGWYVDQIVCGEFIGRSKEEAQLMQFCNLFYWHFINEGTNTYSSDFWSEEQETEDWLFATVEEPYGPEPYVYEGMFAWNKKHPERTSFEYGTYIEANHIIREMVLFEPHFEINVLIPFYEKQSFPFTFSESTTILIYTGQRDVVIHPALIADEKGDLSIHYYVFLNGNEAYEWTYFPVESASELSIETVKTKLNALTGFFFEQYSIIRDQRFWDQYVLKKNGENYAYLRRIN